MICFKCQHFAFSWTRKFPYTCKAWGIRSQHYPSLAVHAASGCRCQLYQPRKPSVKPLAAKAKPLQHPRSRVDKLI